MKRIVARILMFIVFLPLSFSNTAQAYTKAYEDCEIEYLAAMNDLNSVAAIRNACDECILAFESGDQEALKVSYQIIVDAGLMPEHYSLKDTLPLEGLRDTYAAIHENKLHEYGPVIEHYIYWGAQKMKIAKALNDAAQKHSPIVPVPLNSSYEKNVIYDLPEDFFKEGQDLSSYEGNIYLIDASVYEAIPEQDAWYFLYTSHDYGDRLILVAQPSYFGEEKYDVSDMPDAGGNGLFYITYFSKRDDGCKMFILGANDYTITAIRTIGSANDPV